MRAVNAKEADLSATTLEMLIQAYGPNYPDPGTRPRRAKKLCAPCCHVVAYAPVRYCDAVSVPGQAYCPLHRQNAAADTAQPAKPGLMRGPEKAGTWRTRSWN